MARPRPYKVYMMSPDGTETQFAIRRLRVEMSPSRAIEIDLTPRGDFMIRLDSPCRGRSASDLRASRLVVYQNGSNSLSVHITSRDEP